MGLELFNRVVTDLKERKAKVEQGGVNCIPFNFPRFAKEVAGIEQGQYYQITASTKVGKSQINDAMFLYNPLFYALNNPEKLRVKIFYFTLEMSKEQKYVQFISHLLFVLSKGGVRISPKDLRSVREDSPLSQDVLDIIESDEYREYFDFFEKSVEFIDDIRHPTGIMKFMQEYAKASGTAHKKIIDIVDHKTGEVTQTEVFDYYEPHDPKEYVIVIVDHMALLTPENGTKVRDAMIKLSAEYFIKLRNRYKYIPVGIIQQSASQESNENARMNKLKPTLDGFGDLSTLGFVIYFTYLCAN